jgi:6,7-dimethyl-8-ribityllumazine synthase
VSGRLLDGAVDALIRHDVKHQDIELFWVPGPWELPLMAKEAAISGKFDAIIALGAVIQGDPQHLDFMCGEMSKGLASVALEHRVPVGFGVVTTLNIEQALVQAGSKAGNKGVEAAMAALEMANLLSEARKTMGLTDQTGEETAG